MNTQEKKEALVQAVEEIAGKEAAYWGRESEDAGNISELLCKYCKNHDKIS